MMQTTLDYHDHIIFSSCSKTSDHCVLETEMLITMTVYHHTTLGTCQLNISFSYSNIKQRKTTSLLIMQTINVAGHH